MPNTVAIALEGPGADLALKDLLALPGIQGSAQPAEQKVVMREGGVLVAIGTIVGIVGGIASVVSSIIDWREKWKAANQAQRLSVVIEDGRGNRLALDSATPEQITAALQTLNP